MTQLPVPVDRNEATRRLLALNAGREAGWWTYEPRGETSKPTLLMYEVTLPSKRGKPLVRLLHAVEVLPWALGVADAKGAPDVVAYREGLLPEKD